LPTSPNQFSVARCIIMLQHQNGPSAREQPKLLDLNPVSYSM